METILKHTPGPWKIFNGVREQVNLPQYQRKDSCRVILDDTGLALAEMRMGNPGANANLIASAPEMLEALHSVRRMLMTEFSAEGQPHIAIQLDIINAAIAKATGGVM